jgi:hypothetical protein
VFERAAATRQDAPRPAILQAKLVVGRSGDQAEREADRVAAAAMSPLRSPVEPGASSRLATTMSRPMV